MFRKIADLQAQHKERYQPTGFAFAFADRIDALNPEHWDGVTRGGTFFLGRPYLALVERHGPREFTHRYALLYSGDEPVAALSVQCVDLPAARLVSRVPAGGAATKRKRDKVANLLRRARNKGLQQLEPRVLVCGNLLTWGQHGVAIRPGDDAPSIWRGIAEALYRIRRADKLNGKTDVMMLKDLAAGQQPGIEALRRIRYRPFATEPDMVLTLDPAWRTYDDYLGSLSARYRKAAQKLRRALEQAGYNLEVIEDLSGCADEIHALYMQVHDKAGVRPVTIPPDYLPALAKMAGAKRFRCTLARAGSRIAGFVTTIKDGDRGLAYLIGFDCATNAEAPIYLSLLQRVVDDGITLGCKSLSLGRTALEPKSRLGALPVPTEVWLRHTTPVLNHLIHPLLSAIPHNEAPDRNPFKEVETSE